MPTVKQTVNLSDVLKERQYKPGHTPPPESIVFTIQNENIGSKGNFICLSGLPKAGKSTYLNAIISSSFVPYNVFGMKLTVKNNIGYFDTESSNYDFYKNIYRIKQFAGYVELPRSFQAFNTRKDAYSYQRALIEQYIIEYKPDVLIIDGLLDLVKNYNDESESRALIDWIKFATEEYNMLIIGCIHLGKKDNHTLGHFGSMVDRYAQSVLEIVRDIENDLFILKPKLLRSSRYFEPIAIQLQGTEYVKVMAPIEKPKNKK